MNEHELLSEALKRTDPAERAAFLDQSCAGDSELRRRLVELLAGNAESGGTLDQTPSAPAESYATADLPTPIATGEHRPSWATEALARPDHDATTARESASPAPRAAGVPTGEGIGTVIAGRYTLVDVIGEGGMGSVYLASQTEPVKRQVALKLIKSGMDSRGVLARFDAERQALALMDHPNIARIYDGGLTPAGQPFFVMELVEGVPLAEYCDEHRLTITARLELFVSVCQAVQHAHQKGIIHRDLKPGNVLVTEVDGRPTSKVIDFGVAKATEVKLTDMSLADVGAIVGTPAYMSPEQADPSSVDIDTRTDVYALGVMLYELLTGSPPIDARQFQRGAILEMLRMVREVDPPRPSTKLSTAEALPNIAANRSIEPAKLAKLLERELDWVVMKALEKDRTRRYETASGFARDIERYLADEVVEARPPSRGYRLKKLVKRNKIQVIAVSVVFLTLVAGIVGTSWGMWDANKARAAERKRADGERDAKIDAQRARDAEAEQRGIAVSQRDKATASEAKAIASERKAREEAAKTQAINDFLTNDLLTQAEPANNAVEDKVTLLEVLDRAALKVGKRFMDQPILEDAIRCSIGGSFHGLASWEKAEREHRAILALRRRSGCAPADVYAAEDNLAHVLMHSERSREEALTLAKSAMEGLSRVLGPEHPQTLTSMAHLGSAYRTFGIPDQAVPLLAETLKRRSAALGPEHPDTLSSMNNLATAYRETGQLGLALPIAEDTVTRSKAVRGPDHPETLAGMNNLAWTYLGVGKTHQALALFRDTLKLMKAKLGPEHPNTLTCTLGLADAYNALGQFELAMPLYEQVLALEKAIHGPDYPGTLGTMNNLAVAYWQQKKLDKSIPLFEETLKVLQAKIGRDHPNTQMTVANLGVNYKDAGRLAEALPLLEEANRSAKRYASLGWVGEKLLDTYRLAGKTEEAAALAKTQLADARNSLPKDSPELAGVLAQIGLSLLQQKKWTEAEPLLRECLTIREKQQPDDWRTFNTQSLLGAALLGQKKYAEAESLLRKGYEGMKERENTIPPQGRVRLPESLDRLIDFYTTTNKPDEIKKWQAERSKYPATAPPPGKK